MIDLTTLKLTSVHPKTPQKIVKTQAISRKKNICNEWSQYAKYIKMPENQ